MDAFRDRRIEKISLCFGTQLGKSEAILNMMGYVIDQDPGTMFVVYPTDELAKSIAKNRIIPMVRLSDALSGKWDPGRTSEIMEIQFFDMYIALRGANSPAKLASHPVRYIFYDETDKFPLYTGKEGKPTELAGERTKNFRNRKEEEASSPTVSTGHIWKAFVEADIRKRYFVPCPHCGAMWTFKMGQIKWPEELNEPAYKSDRNARVLTESWYECEICHSKIYDMDKFLMLTSGEWRAVARIGNGWEETVSGVSRPRHVAFNLSSIYSPWITFGQVAQKFLASKDDQSMLMNFVNGWLGEPWEQEAMKLRSDVVFERQANHARGTVPMKALLLTCGIDVQLDHFWWVVRAWGSRLTSWLVDFGRCETWSELDEMLDREYPQEGREPMQINLAFIDSGDRTDEVYQYCSTRPGFVFPCKGSSARLARAPFTESKVDKDGFGDMRLFIVDGHYYKSFIAGRLRKKTDEPGSFCVFNSEDEEGWLRVYADQICSEQLVKEQDKKGRTKDIWKPITSHAANHLLDAECYGIAAAERAGVRYLRDEEDE